MVSFTDNGTQQGHVRGTPKDCASILQQHTSRRRRGGTTRGCGGWRGSGCCRSVRERKW